MTITAEVISVGVLGAIITGSMLKILRVDNQVVLGFALGISEHGWALPKRLNIVLPLAHSRVWG